MLLAQPFAQLGRGDVLGFHSGDVEHGLEVGIRHHRSGNDTGDGHQAAQDHTVGDALAAEAHLLAVFLPGEDADQNGPDHGGIFFIIDGHCRGP